MLHALRGPSGSLRSRSRQRIERTSVGQRDRGKSSIYSPVSNIGDIWSLEERADESSIVLDIDKVGLNAFLQQFV